MKEEGVRRFCLTGETEPLEKDRKVHDQTIQIREQLELLVRDLKEIFWSDLCEKPQASWDLFREEEKRWARAVMFFATHQTRTADAAPR